MALGAHSCGSGAESGGLEGQAREQTVWRLAGRAQFLCGAKLDGAVRLPPSYTWSSSGSSLWTSPPASAPMRTLSCPPLSTGRTWTPLGHSLARGLHRTHELSWHREARGYQGPFKEASPLPSVCRPPLTPVPPTCSTRGGECEEVSPGSNPRSCPQQATTCTIFSVALSERPSQQLGNEPTSLFP